MFSESCQNGVDIGGVGNTNQHPRSLRRSLESTTVSSAPSRSSPSPLTVRINQAFVSSFAQVIQNTPCANLEYTNLGGASSKGFASTAFRSFAWIMSVCAWSRLTSGWSLCTIAVLIPTAASLYVPVYTWVLLGFLGCCFSWDGVFESEWGVFTPPLLPAVPLS